MRDLLALAPLLVIAAVVGVVLLEQSIRRTAVGVVLIALPNTAEIVFDRWIEVQVGSLTVAAYDVVFAILALATVARTLRARGRSDLLRLALLGLGAVAVLSLLRGAGEFGLQPAVNEFRKTFYFVTGALYVASADPARELYDRIGRIWLAVSVVLGGLVVLRWLSLVSGLPLGPFALGERALSRELMAEGSLRVVHADDTLIMLQGFLIAVSAWRSLRSPWMGRLAIVLLAIVFLLQHRTVWVTTVLALALVLLRDRDLGRRLTLLLAGAVAAVGVLVFVLLDAGQSDVGGQLATAVSDSGTFSWRFEGWIDLIRDPSNASLTNTLLGRPFGAGWTRFLNGGIVRVAPHNYYVELFLRVGLAGMACLALALAPAVVRLWRSRDRDGLLSDGVVLLLIASQLTFFLTYDPAPLQAVVAGLALAAARTRTPGPQAEAPVHAEPARVGWPP